MVLKAMEWMKSLRDYTENHRTAFEEFQYLEKELRGRS